MVSTRFPHLETVNPTIPPTLYIPCIGNLGENSQVVSMSFHTWKQSTRQFQFVSLHWKILGKPYKGFPRVSTQVNRTVNLRIPFRSLAWKINGYVRHCYFFLSHASAMFSKRHFQSNYYFKVMKMTIELKKASPFHICMSLHKDVWSTEFFF